MEMKEQENEHTIHTMNSRCIMGNLKWEKTQLEGEAYALLYFIQLEK
jgi:hypothetical protein